MHLEIEKLQGYLNTNKFDLERCLLENPNVKVATTVFDEPEKKFIAFTETYEGDSSDGLELYKTTGTGYGANAKESLLNLITNLKQSGY